MPTSKDFTTEHLRPHERVIAEAVLSVLPDDATGGGCQAFYSPDKWKERGETYGHGSLLIVVHDGGDLAPYCSLDYGCYGLNGRMVEALSKAGVYVEQCTSWYSAIYLG